MVVLCLHTMHAFDKRFLLCLQRGILHTVGGDEVIVELAMKRDRTLSVRASTSSGSRAVEAALEHEFSSSVIREAITTVLSRFEAAAAAAGTAPAAFEAVSASSGDEVAKNTVRKAMSEFHRMEAITNVASNIIKAENCGKLVSVLQRACSRLDELECLRRPIGRLRLHGPSMSASTAGLMQQLYGNGLWTRGMVHGCSKLAVNVSWKTVSSPPLCRPVQ